MIKIGGEWLSSLELEDIICSHPAIVESAVIGTNDVKWGERPLALVVLNSDLVDPPTERELIAHTKGFVDKGLLSKHAVLMKVTFVATIDKTSVGKVNKRLLREKYAK